MMHSVVSEYYSAFDLLQKVDFCLAFDTEDVHLQTFVML